MRTVLIVIAALFGSALALALALGWIRFDVGPQAAVCREDNEIPSDQRQAIGDTAMTLAHAIASNDAVKAYALLTPEAQAALTPQANAAFVSSIGQLTFNSLSDLRLSHIYLVDSVGSSPEARGMCGTFSNNNWVSLEIKNGQRNAHVAVVGKTRNNDWEIDIWLLAADNQWRAQYVHVGASTMVGLSAADLLRKAREESSGGHIFNATMLYAGAQSLTDRGPSFELGIAQEIRSDLSSFTPASDLQGKPPFSWQLRGKNYRVQQVTIVGIDNKLGLVFVLPHTSWPAAETDIDADNQAFLDAFRATHPDYGRAFSFLVARAMKPDNSGGFGTVYDNAKGYH